MEEILKGAPTLVQIFLSESQVPGPSIFEVSITDDGKVICNCPSFKGRSSCTHAKIVMGKMEFTSGVYIPELHPSVTEEDIEKALLSEKHNREFIIKFGIPEVV